MFNYEERRREQQLQKDFNGCYSGTRCCQLVKEVVGSTPETFHEHLPYLNLSGVSALRKITEGKTLLICFSDLLQGKEIMTVVNMIIGIYHRKYPTSHSILMYLLGTVCCQNIHKSQIQHWILICTLL